MPLKKQKWDYFSVVLPIFVPYMRRIALKYGLLVLLLFCQLDLLAQRGSLTLPTDTADTWQVSLITCGPGKEVYNQFGHSAIRMKNDSKGIDLIYNYGVFSFDTPNFSLRFTLGQTDYMLGVQHFEDFVNWYAYSKRDVREQVLNFNIDEKNTLIGLLNENYKPQNRFYRYNFFYDNCSTRPRDLIEKCLQGKLTYVDDMNSLDTGETFRSVVHEFTTNNAWSQFGIDLCLGSQADEPITKRMMMFIPLYLEKYFESAYLRPHTANNSYTQSNIISFAEEKKEALLVSESLQLVTIPEAEKIRKDTPFTPFRCFTLLFMAVAALTIYGIKRSKSLWWLDLLLFLAAGIAGCLLTFLAVFSEHPTVSPNYLLLLFHPLHLFCLPWVISRVKKKQTSRYLLFILAELTIFIILMPIIPQVFPLAVLPLALCLLVRSVSNWLLAHASKQ